MKKSVLNSREIMYLCAVLGANEVYGIADGFAFVPQSKLSQAVNETIDSLTAKGCLEMDFDGNNTIEPVTADTVKIIAQSQSHLILHSLQNGLQYNPCIFYRSGGETVKSEFKNDAFEISKITVEEMRAEINSRFSASLSEGGNLGCRLQSAVFENARKLAVGGKREEAAKLLCDNGVDGQCAELIVKGFVQKSDFVSVVVSCTVKGRESTDGMVTLSDENIALDITPSLVGEEEYTDISSVSVESQKAKLESILLKYGFWG